MTKAIEFPPFPLPISGKVHPHVDIENPLTDYFQLVTLEFCERFQLYHSEEQRIRLQAIEHSRCAAWMYPYGSDELLQIGSDFTLWAFAYDDEYCDEGPLSNDPVLFMQKACEILRAADCPEEPPCSEDKYAMALRDIRQRLDRYAKPIQVARFAEAMRWYVTTEVLKIELLKPSLNDHLFMRMYAGGGMAFPVLAHAISDIEITPEEYEDRRVRALLEMLAMMMVLDTEPIAYGKELARAVNDKEHNVIQIIRRDRQCGFEEALTHFFDIRWRMMSLYFRLREDVMKDASPGLRDFIDSCAYYYKGGVVWMLGTKRYMSVSGLATGLIGEVDLLEEGPPESFESAGIPCVEWWWEYDPARRAGYQAGDGRLTFERHRQAAMANLSGSALS